MKKIICILLPVLLLFTAFSVAALQPLPEFIAESDVRFSQQINDKLFFSTNWNIYCSDLDGTNRMVVVEVYTGYTCNYKGIPFVVDEKYIYYAGYNSDPEKSGTLRCDVDGENQTMIASGLRANKLSLVGNELFYSAMLSAGKIDLLSLENTPFIKTNAVKQMGQREGTHRMLNDKFIITDYAIPHGYERFGKSPTIIMDLDGNLITVWEDTLVTRITEKEGKIYAQIDILDEGGNVTISRDLYLISDDFKTRTVKPITVEINGEQIAFDVPPQMIEGRTLVPLRAIFEAMGVAVDWNGDTQTISAFCEVCKAKGINHHVTMNIGDRYMYIYRATITPGALPPPGMARIELDAPPMLIDGRTLVPVRAVSESFHATVDWDGITDTVIVNY